MRMSPKEKRDETIRLLQETFALDAKVDMSKVSRLVKTDKRIEWYICDTLVGAIIETSEEKFSAAFSMFTNKNKSGATVETRGYTSEKSADFKSARDHMSIALGRQLFTAAESAFVAKAASESDELRDKNTRLELVQEALELLFADDDDETVLTRAQWEALDDKYRERFEKLRPSAIPALDDDDDDDESTDSDPDDDDDDDETTESDDESTDSAPTTDDDETPATTKRGRK